MPVNEELVQYITENMTLFRHCGYHYYEDIHCFTPKEYLKEEQRIRDLEVYEDDVWVLTYPKCGTTWCMEMVWLICNNMDYKSAETRLEERFPFLELSTILKGDEMIAADIKGTPTDDMVAVVEQLPRPRYIKSHLPVGLLPKQLFQKNPKIIFVIREPKDTAVSFLNHYRVFNRYYGSDAKFYEAFLDGCVQWGCYWYYLAGFFKLLHEHPNILVLTYEEMKKDLEAVIQRTAEFLGKPVKEGDMPRLLDHLSFAKMKTNNATNFHDTIKKTDEMVDCKGKRDGVFMRKGEVGDYKNSMSEGIVNKYEEHNAKMKLELGLADDKNFPY